MIELNYNLEPIVYFCEVDNIFKTEIFKDVPEYVGKYQVSDIGRLKSLSRKVRTGRGGKGFRFVDEKILKPQIRRDGYLYSILTKPFRNYAIHQLVAIVFLGHERCGFETVVDHKNNNKLDNRAINMQLVSNRVNSTKDNKNKTGYIGVTRQGALFKATIRKNGVSTYLGMFKSADSAHEGYLKARKEIESVKL